MFYIVFYPSWSLQKSDYRGVEALVLDSKMNQQPHVWLQWQKPFLCGFFLHFSWRFGDRPKLVHCRRYCRNGPLWNTKTFGWDPVQNRLAWGLFGIKTENGFIQWSSWIYWLACTLFLYERYWLLTWKLAKNVTNFPSKMAVCLFWTKFFIISVTEVTHEAADLFWSQGLKLQHHDNHFFEGFMMEPSTLLLQYLMYVNN